MIIMDDKPITVRNSVTISSLECREILKRLELCSDDVKMGLPISESHLDTHLAELTMLVKRVVKQQQPTPRILETPM